MWELIALNRKKSIFVFFLMMVLLILMGAALGYTVSFWIEASSPVNASIIGGIGAFFVWLILSFVSYTMGNDIVIRASRATQITRESYPRLYNIVEEIKIAAMLPAMPEIYIMNDDALNAFATGMHPEKSAIIVTSGLAEVLSRDELQGVVAHEMSHILNRDTAFLTFAGIMLGTITVMADIVLRGTFFASRNRRSKMSSKNNSGGGNIIILLLIVVFAILAPFFAKIFYLSISRKREYLADATAVRLTRYPEGLASALEKISSSTTPVFAANTITAPMYIASPAGSNIEKEDLGSTHPPIVNRIRILRALQNGGGASYRDYQQAYSKYIEKGFANLIPESGLKENKPVIIRDASKEDKSFSQKKTKRDINDLFIADSGYVSIPCSCGLEIKAPAKFGVTDIQCPRCGKILTVPSITAKINKAAEKEEKRSFSSDEVLQYHRMHPGKWESVLCKCGAQLQLSPLFKSQYLVCKSCKRKIEII